MVQINSELLDTLKSFSSKYAFNVNICVVWFIGYYEQESKTPVIVSCIRGAQSDGNVLDISQDINSIYSVIPSGLSVVGFFLHTQAIGGNESKVLSGFLQQQHKNISMILSQSSLGNKGKEKEIILATTKKSLQAVESEDIHFFSLESAKFIQSANEATNITKVENINGVPYSQLSSQVKESFFLVRVNFSMDFSFVYPEGGYVQRLQETAASVLDSIKTGNFIISATNNILINGIDGKANQSLVSDTLRKDAHTEWIDTTILVAQSSSVKKPATLSHNQGNEPFRQGKTTYQLSVLNYITSSQTVAQFIANVSNSLYVQAAALIKSSNPNTSPAPLHFLPPKFPHPVTLVYPIDKTASHTNEDYLLTVRTNYHRQLLLPLDKPLLRDGNKINFDSQSPSLPSSVSNPLENDYRLKDVHLQLQLDEGTSTGGSKFLVKGSYLYYHYQQEMNDSGWGCAYRSLQTICSWMVLQGYTSKPVPTILEIQQILVEVKDKEKKFIGSTNWIGSPEVFLCLDHLYGVSSKILNVSSGADLLQKGAELSQHFRTEGTPIMIGGGVLAYTLLGVDYDSSSGNIKFLILDPHYVGPENLKNIRDKWCSWKTGDIFRKDAFYNLCMPLRPKKV